MFHRFFIFSSFLLLFSECAQIVPLTGGEKDTSPPDLISVIPSDLTKNFKAEIILFKFNERIQLKNPGDNIIMVPATDTKPKWKVNKKELEIILPPNLKPNTTYKLMFNKAIADLTESNAIDYLEYVFSTGEIIDSNFIKGIKFHYVKTMQQVLDIAITE